MRAILAGQPPSAQVAGARGSVYGSEGWRFEFLQAPLGRTERISAAVALRSTAAGGRPLDVRGRRRRPTQPPSARGLCCRWGLPASGAALSV
jgi:hypothetical protein